MVEENSPYFITKAFFLIQEGFLFLYMQHEIQNINLNSNIPLIHIKGNFDFSICSLNVKAGFSNDPKTKNGIAHTLEHLLGKNPKFKNLTDKYLFLEKNTIDSYAFTRAELTNFFSFQPNFNLEKSLKIIIDSINSVLITEQDLDKERQILLNELSTTKSSINSYYWQLIYKNLFKNSSLSNDIFGNKIFLKQQNISDLIDFKNKFYTLDNIYFFTLGSMDIKEISKFLNKITLNLNPKSEYHDNLPSKINSYKKYDKNLPESLFLFSYKLDNINENFFMADFIRNYLCSSYMSVFIKRFRLKDNITYWPFSETEFLENTGYINFGFDIDCKYKELLLNGFQEEIENLQNNKIENLKSFKDFFVFTNKRYFSDPENLFNFYNTQYRNNNHIIDLDEYFKKIMNIKKSDISNFSKKYFTKDNLSIIEIV